MKTISNTAIRINSHSSNEPESPVQKQRTAKTLPWIVAGIVGLILLNKIGAVHDAIERVDLFVALSANSIVGKSYLLDQLMGRVTTRFGDAIMLSIMVGILAVHCLQPKDFHEKARRIAFWGVNGVVCVSTYVFCCLIQNWFMRKIPLAALPQLHNLTKMYGLVPHTSAAESFPSGHALAFLFFAVAAWFAYRRMSFLLLAVGCFVLSIRLIIGIHWLSDMMLGSLPLSLLLVSLTRETPLRIAFAKLEDLAYFCLNKITGRKANDDVAAAFQTTQKTKSKPD